MSKRAFTLAELLIAMLIVGVILLLTLPPVVKNFNKKSLVVALQRTYTAVNNAVGTMMMDDRAKNLNNSTLYISSSSDTVTSTAGVFLKNYFKVVLDCETEPGDCFASSYTNLNRSTVSLPSSGDAYCVHLATGASICLTPPNSTDLVSAKFYVDVNGTAKPNIAGRDYFVFYVYMDGFTGDRGTDTAQTSSFCMASYGAGCFNVIKDADWVMDY